MERLLSCGYSSVHTRVGFDIAMFRPKSKEYLVQNDKIVDDLRNIYGEPDEKSQRKVLMQNLIDLWKNEDRKNPHKIIYNLCFDGEEQSQPGRAFSKICKLVENNQYGFAMNLTIQKKKKKKMYNEIYLCIFQPKTKVPAYERSVYQLLSNMRVGKKDNILKFLVTEKTH